jgi:hypothetical protein
MPTIMVPENIELTVLLTINSMPENENVLLKE